MKRTLILLGWFFLVTQLDANGFGIGQTQLGPFKSYIACASQRVRACEGSLYNVGTSPSVNVGFCYSSDGREIADDCQPLKPPKG